MCLKHSSSATATGTLVTKVKILIKTVLLGTTTKLGQHDHFLVDFFDLFVVFDHGGTHGGSCHGGH